MVMKIEGPDQARSWSIAMAGCVINCLLGGISRSTGLFYVALIETYGVSRMEANMPFTLRNVVRNLGGPLAGAIGQRYGARDVTFIGCVLAVLGITLCTFAPNVMWISILWGGMHGFGTALGYTLVPVIINQYFHKYRATASGLSLAGSCVGAFVLPVALEYMINHTGLSGTFLLSGGIIMHILPAALLIKEPPWIQRKITKEKKKPDEKDILKNSLPADIASQNFRNIRENDGHVPEIDIKNKPSSGTLCDVCDIKHEVDNFHITCRSCRGFSRNGIDNSAFEGSTADVTEENKNLECEIQEELRMRSISIGEASLIFPEKLEEVQETSIIKALVKVIRDPMFHVISMSLAGFAMLIDPAFTVIVDYVRDKGLQENDAKYFIIMMSVGDLLGRLCFGWVTDRNYMSLPKFMLLIQVVQGICFLLLPAFHTFDVLMIVILIYGLASGATLVMYPILVAKYLVSVQSLATGFISFLTGLLGFTVPPLIGYFRDNAGSYDHMFLITGGFSIAVGCLWLLEPFLTRIQKSQRSASIAISS